MAHDNISGYLFLLFTVLHVKKSRASSKGPVLRSLNILHIGITKNVLIRTTKNVENFLDIGKYCNA